MKKNILKIIMILIILLTLTGCVSKEETIAASISGGYIPEHNGLYYFANPDDQNKLYQMDANFENTKKLSDLSSFSIMLHIEVSGDNLFYIQNSKSKINN